MAEHGPMVSRRRMLSISGTPNNGSSFAVTPATQQANANVFNTLDSIIAALQTPVSSTQAGLSNLPSSR